MTAAVTAVATQGFKKGHPEFLDRLFPQGTIARGDLEGLLALRKQVPEVAQSIKQSAPPSKLPELPEVDVSAVTSALAGLATDPDRRREVEEELKNAFRSTPKGLETPKYRVTRTLGGDNVQVELRAYEPLTVARREMSPGFGTTSGGEGFNALASYLFGGNEEKQTLAMTAPVEIRSGATSSMAFVIPKASATAPPTPLTPDVTLEEVAARLVAVKSFRGIVTDEEVERQKLALLEALAADDGVVVTNPDEFSVLQYNACANARLLPLSLHLLVHRHPLPSTHRHTHHTARCCTCHGPPVEREVEVQGVP